jgi:hypothetical protein
VNDATRGDSLVLGSSDFVQMTDDPTLRAMPLYAGSCPLGPLQHNGGPTWTILPPDGSPLINAGYNLVASGLATDQRGGKRIRGRPALVDIGSVEVNHAPVAPATEVQTIQVGKRFEYIPGATDPDGDALTYTWSGLPRGASVDASGRLLTWTPGREQAPGRYTVTVRISDGDLTTKQQLTLLLEATGTAGTLVGSEPRSIPLSETSE